MSASKIHLSEKTKTLSWELKDSTMELALDHAPCNEIGTAMVRFGPETEAVTPEAGTLHWPFERTPPTTSPVLE